MAYTYDWVNFPQLATLRMMVGDTDMENPIFDDYEIQGALNINSSQNIIVGLSGYYPPALAGNVYSYGRAAAMLLNGLSSTKARVLVAKVLDVSVTPGAASKALQDLGQSYINQEISAGYFSVAEMGQDPFWMRERLWKQLYRQQA
jgi:hypothetical protein